MADVCFNSNGCVAVNSNGIMKSQIQDPAELVPMPNPGPCDGLFVMKGEARLVVNRWFPGACSIPPHALLHPHCADCTRLSDAEYCRYCNDNAQPWTCITGRHSVPCKVDCPTGLGINELRKHKSCFEHVPQVGHNKAIKPCWPYYTPFFRDPYMEHNCESPLNHPWTGAVYEAFPPTPDLPTGDLIQQCTGGHIRVVS